VEGGKGRLALAGAAFLLGLAASFLLIKLSAAAAWNAEQRPAQGLLVPSEPAPDGRYRYRRIVCMSPAVAEIVFALGAADRVVGVSQHTSYPPEALKKPTCGGFINPNYELLLSLQPDLIVTQGRAEVLSHFAGNNAIDILSLDLSDLESIFEQTARAGRALQLESEAELVCSEMRYRLAQVHAQVSRKPAVPVVLVTGREPGALNGITVVGPGTFLNDLIQLAGGRNVFGDLHAAYAVVNKEALLERAPQVIVELQGEGGEPGVRQEDARDVWNGLPSLRAVQQGRVYVVEASYALIPGPRIVLLARRLADVFHEGDG